MHLPKNADSVKNVISLQEMFSEALSSTRLPHQRVHTSVLHPNVLLLSSSGRFTRAPRDQARNLAIPSLLAPPISLQAPQPSLSNSRSLFWPSPRSLLQFWLHGS